MYGYFFEIADEPIIRYENAEYYLFDNLEYYETYYNSNNRDQNNRDQNNRDQNKSKIARQKREICIDKWFVEDEASVNKKWFYRFFICMFY
jgi:hypothetical protein